MPKAPTSPYVSGDSWTDAIMALHERGEVEPLAANLGAMAEAAPQVARQFHDLARLLRLLHAGWRPPAAPKPSRGKPGGPWWRWQDPNYVAAWWAEAQINNLKRETSKQKISASKREQIIGESVAKINSWHFAKTRKAKADRVREILRTAKKHRL